MEEETTNTENIDALVARYESWIKGAVARVRNLPAGALSIGSCEEVDGGNALKVYVHYTHPEHPYYNKTFIVRAEINRGDNTLLNFSVTQLG